MFAKKMAKCIIWCKPATVSGKLDLGLVHLTKMIGRKKGGFEGEFSFEGEIGGPRDDICRSCADSGHSPNKR